MSNNIKKLSKKQRFRIYLLVVTSIIFVSFVGYYEYNKSIIESKMLNASNSYQKALIVFRNNKSTTEQKIKAFQFIKEKYPNTAYGIYSSWNQVNLMLNRPKLDYKKIEKILITSIKNNPNNNLSNITKTRLARIYMANNQNALAIKLLKEVKLHNSNAYIIILLGDAYAQNKNNKSAKEEYEKALNMNLNSSLKSVIKLKLNSLKV